MAISINLGLLLLGVLTIRVRLTEVLLGPSIFGKSCIVVQRLFYRL